MNMSDLIALAASRSGQTRGELAKEMGHPHQSRVSRLAKGESEPYASEVIFLAEKAQLAPLETLAKIEAANHPEFAETWERLRERVKGAWHYS